MMDQDPEKKTLTLLLVGEGNFSFAASLCDAGSHHITATCCESEEVVCTQHLTWSSVQHLRSQGAAVHFGVDATKLHEYVFLSNQPYDRIIFNFPHCGRKAGVKKNRDLLCHFFRSCAEVLSPKGEVHVALCEGQGGTPADQPKREWHNSWQVAAMAAMAGFILTSVVPFDSDQHCGYQSTGYRSQQKSFHVVGALTHVFTRSLPLENLAALQLIDALTSVQDPKCTEAAVDRGFLWNTSCHPISVIYKELIKRCEEKLPLNVIEDTFPLTCQDDSCLGRPSYPAAPSSLYFVMPGKDKGASEIMDDFHKKDILQAPYLGSTQTNPGTGLCHLRPSLTCFIDDLTRRAILRPNDLTIVSGLVFRKCLISPRTLPVYHEVLMMLAYRGHTLTDRLQLLMDTVKDAIDTIAVSVILPSTETKDNEKMGNCLSRFVVTFHQNKEDYTITFSSADFDQIIGTIRTVPPGEQYEELGFLTVALNIDLVAMSLLGIEDWRMLWTEDERFIEQFRHQDLKPFQSFSLYPPYYIHDVSFWVDGNSVFDHVQFHTIALRMSKGNIVDVQLLDRYENVETGRTGLCYRMKYQSCDRALGYRSALTMQLLLREELQRSLRVTVR
ncbi:ferredoxin-fold anticodon-binding domain-containing protein 1 [Bufo gargarizans]|uniref:ferredoxin-fold anticodon-binding domain-containing protein 1 n=1 Tax=Bufo gargarizans TaxID=30331 RepID=UPI001CF237B6|nr:ferredoxin-fold anticodon-binding domain-containing protein 1 [Bufo gargarizans]